MSISKSILISLGLTAWGVAAQEDGPASGVNPRQAMDQGISAYAEGNLDEAGRQFQAAVDAARQAGETLPEAVYNQGNVAFKRHQFDEAVTHYQEATRTENLSLQEDAHYNTGTTLLNQFSAPEEDPKALEAAIEGLDKAKKSLRRSLLLNPDSPDARKNFEVADQKKKVLEKKLEELKQEQQQEQQGDENKEDQEKKKDEQEPSEDQKKDGQEQQDPDGKEKPQENQENPENSENQKPGDQEKMEDQGDEQKEQPGEGEQKESPEEKGAGQTSEGDPKSSEELTEQEAARLLQAMREQESQNRQDILMRMMQRNQAKEIPVEKDY